MTTVGLIGSGNIGITVAQLAIDAGHHVVLSNSHGPETLADTVAELGPRASAATSGDAAAIGDIVVVTVPVKAFPDLPAAPLAGKTVIDTCNYGPERDGHIPELDSNALTSSELLSRYMPGAGLVKAPALTRPPGGSGRPLVATDRRGLRAGEGGGDRLH
jgi:predicted dinucleotide-binding enzyme